MKNFRMQHSLGNDQHCKTTTTGTDALTNHTWDASCEESVKCKKKQCNVSKQQNNDKDDRDKKQFAQGNKKAICHCCGKNHCTSECTEKDKKPRCKWTAMKETQMSNKENEKDEPTKKKENQKSGNLKAGARNR